MTAEPYRAVDAAIVAATPAIERICSEVWEHAELSLEEIASAQVHMRELEAAGFTITSRGTSGQATAFIAEWEQGAAGPRIGFLPEYDALPSLGNAALSQQAMARRVVTVVATISSAPGVPGRRLRPKRSWSRKAFLVSFACMAVPLKRQLAPRSSWREMVCLMISMPAWRGILLQSRRPAWLARRPSTTSGLNSSGKRRTPGWILGMAAARLMPWNFFAMG
jgi:hypothetical protein